MNALLADCDYKQVFQFWLLAQQKIRGSTVTDFGHVLPEYAWGDLLAVLPDVVPGDAHRLYCVTETQKPNETRIALFMIADNCSVSLVQAHDGHHHDHSFDATYVTRRMGPLATPALLARYHKGALPSLLKEFVQYPLAPNFSGIPTGCEQWLSRAMVPLSQASGNLPAEIMEMVRKRIGNCDDDDDDNDNNDITRPSAWFKGSMRVSLFEERRLQLLLRLFADRQAARLASPLFTSGGASLVDRAAAAYRGRINTSHIPDDILRRTAAYAWHNICTETPLPSGRLPRADNLVAVARALGVEPDPLQQQYPELLCGVLAEPAVIEIATSRYSIQPIPRGAGKARRNLTACQLWRWKHASTLPPGSAIDKVTSPLIYWLRQKGITIVPQDKADARQFYVRLAAYMVPPLYLD